MKLYFNKNHENCYPIQYHLDFMRESGIEEMEIFEAEVERNTDHFYCGVYFDILSFDKSCGKQCEFYNPRNGKNGKCIFYSKNYSPSLKSKILKIKT